MADEFDVIVIGGGTAGLTSALAARHEGASVALVEREAQIGGDCTFNGCVPSKAPIEIARPTSKPIGSRLWESSIMPRSRTSPRWRGSATG